ncbi:MAG: helix-turn-helix transcriptional regulator [Bacteroidota bacterium]|nr:helix-turn-helix transcriptional regulator [Bacteroidota bacterium]
MSTEEFIKILGEKRAMHRKQFGVSQNKMQAETGIHIGRIESGKKGLTMKTYVRICEYLEKPVSKMLNEVEEYRKNIEQ